MAFLPLFVAATALWHCKIAAADSAEQLMLTGPEKIKVG